MMTHPTKRKLPPTNGHQITKRGERLVRNLGLVAFGLGVVAALLLVTIVIILVNYGH